MTIKIGDKIREKENNKIHEIFDIRFDHDRDFISLGFKGNHSHEKEGFRLMITYEDFQKKFKIL